MQSAAQAIKIRRANETFRKGYETALESLRRGESIRVTTKVATSILIQHPTIDDRYSTQVRNIGAGVKELYIKDLNDA
jgi:hypothetical protein